MSTHRIAIILLLLLYGGLSNVCIVSFFDGQKEQNKNLESMLGIIASSGEEVGSAYASPDSDTILRSNDGLFEVHIPPGAMHDEQELQLSDMILLIRHIRVVILQPALFTIFNHHMYSRSQSQ